MTQLVLIVFERRALTLDIEKDALRNRRWNLIGCDAEVRSRFLAGNFSQRQALSFHRCHAHCFRRKILSPSFGKCEKKCHCTFFLPVFSNVDGATVLPAPGDSRRRHSVAFARQSHPGSFPHRDVRCRAPFIHDGRRNYRAD